MNVIVKYINELLSFQDCIIIPNFGGIICNTSPAHFSKDMKMIFPPKKELSFNRNLYKSDGLLENHIANKENIPYDKAAKMISLFVDDIKVKLLKDKTISLDNIGAFTLDKKRSLLFEPSNHNFLADAMGMNEIAIIKNKFVIKQYLNRNKKIKISIAAACIASLMFVSGLQVNNKPKPTTLKASIGVENIFKSDQAKAEISPDDEIIKVEFLD